MQIQNRFLTLMEINEFKEIMYQPVKLYLIFNKAKWIVNNIAIIILKSNIKLSNLKKIIFTQNYKCKNKNIKILNQMNMNHLKIY